jgi:hypothetical protein
MITLQWIAFEESRGPAHKVIVHGIAVVVTSFCALIRFILAVDLPTPLGYRLLALGNRPQRRNISSCVFLLASLCSMVRRCRGDSGSS